MKLVLIAFIVASFQFAMATPSLQIKVVARVAGKTVTDRQVLLNTLLDDPDLYKPGLRASSLDQEKFGSGLEKLLTQLMVSEENRVVGSDIVPEKDVKSEFLAVRKRFGDRWDRFLSEYELTEKDVTEKITQKLLVQRALAARVKTALTAAGITNSDAQASLGAAPENSKSTETLVQNREDVARKAIEDWLRQLRLRYRVQNFVVDWSHDQSDR